MRQLRELGARARPDQRLALLQNSLRNNPDHVDANRLMGDVTVLAGRPTEALVQYREASRLMPDAPGPLVSMASIHATDPDPEVRDAARAVELAERAAQLAPTGSPVVAETLAAAYAVDGRLERALEVLQLAIDALPEQRNGERRRLERQLVRYREGGG